MPNQECLTVLCYKNATIMRLAVELLVVDSTVKIGIADAGRKKFVGLARKIKPFYNLYIGKSKVLPF